MALKARIQAAEGSYEWNYVFYRECKIDTDLVENDK